MKKFTCWKITLLVLCLVSNSCMPQTEWWASATVEFRDEGHLENAAYGKVDSIFKAEFDPLTSLNRYMKDTVLMHKAWKTVCEAEWGTYTATLPFWKMEVLPEDGNPEGNRYRLRMCTYTEDTSTELLNAWINVIIAEDSKNVSAWMDAKYDSLGIQMEKLNSRAHQISDSSCSPSPEQMIERFKQMKEVSVKFDVETDSAAQAQSLRLHHELGMVKERLNLLLEERILFMEYKILAGSRINVIQSAWDEAEFSPPGK